MQVTTRLVYLKVLGALSLAGAALAVASLYPLPPHYVSSAVFRITPVVAAGQSASADVLRRETDDRMQRLALQLTGRDNVLRLLLDPALNLYRADHERLPLEDIGERMIDDEDLQVLQNEVPDKDSRTFRVSFAYPDRRKAQAVVSGLAPVARKWNDEYNGAQATTWEALWSSPIPFRESIELTQAASMPTRLPAAYRVALGCGGGLVVGMLVLFFWQLPRLGIRVAACGLAGCAVAGALSLLITEQYTARALLRLTAPFDPAHLSGAVKATFLNDWAPKLRREVLDSDGFQATLRSHGTGLGEAAAGIRMVNGDVRCVGTCLEITFANADKVVARDVVVTLLTETIKDYLRDRHAMEAHSPEPIRFANEYRVGENLDVLLSATEENEKASHYRFQVTLAGAVIGILFAVARWSGTGHSTAARSEPRASASGCPIS